jgi:type IV pilus assembly protein PilN
MIPASGIIINLLETDRSRSRKKKLGAVALLLIMVMGGILAGLYYSALNACQEQQALNRELKIRMAEYRKLQLSLKDSEAIKQQIKVKSDTVAEIEDCRISSTEILQEIADVLPSGVLVTKTRITPDSISMSGLSPDHSEVARFISGLRASPRFKEVRVVASEAGAVSSETEFVVEIDWGVKSR